MTPYNSRYFPLPVLLWGLFFILLTAAVSHHSFFWDTIQLASAHGHWFYENGISIDTLIFPNILDSGNPPLFGMYIALVWSIFGKTLEVSHFAMLPFLLGIVYQVYYLAARFLSGRWIWAAMSLVFSEATLLGQSVLVSPDIVLLFLFLLIIRAILSGKRTLLGMALCFLAMISMRGTLHLISILICDLFYRYRNGIRKPAENKVHILAAYFPALLLSGAWYLFHYLKTGWVGYHEASPWAESFRINASATDFWQSFKMYLFILCDYGKYAGWFALAAFVLLTLKKKIHTDAVLPLCFLLAPLALISPTKFIYFSLMQSRYYLPVFVFLSLAVVCFLSHLRGRRVKIVLYALLLVSFATGNLWVYPERISQNWDGTLAHLPYYHLRRKMMHYLDEQKIPYEQVGTGFPNLSGTKYTDLESTDRYFQPRNLRQNRYVLYSNVFNEFTVKERSVLNREWKMMKRYSFWKIYVKLFVRRPSVPSGTSG